MIKANIQGHTMGPSAQFGLAFKRVQRIIDSEAGILKEFSCLRLISFVKRAEITYFTAVIIENFVK